MGALGGANEKHICVFVCLGVFLGFLDNLKWSSETAHDDVHGLCVCVSVLVSTNRTTQFLFFLHDNLKRSGEAAHGDVGGLTACYVEVGAANFAWRFSQKKIRKVLPGTQNKYFTQITIIEDRSSKYVHQIF